MISSIYVSAIMYRIIGMIKLFSGNVNFKRCVEPLTLELARRLLTRGFLLIILEILSLFALMTLSSILSSSNIFFSIYGLEVTSTLSN